MAIIYTPEPNYVWVDPGGHTLAPRGARAAPNDGREWVRVIAGYRPSAFNTVTRQPSELLARYFHSRQSCDMWCRIEHQRQEDATNARS